MSGLWHHIVSKAYTYFSEKQATYIFKDEEEAAYSLETPAHAKNSTL
jgi:hypothetical protein